MEKPLVSVVIPCWNQAHFLGEAIESVLDQTYDRIEVAVVDDGSVDNCRQVVQRYPGVRYHYQSNRGAAAARNAGLGESRGEFIAFLDADDRLLSSAIEIGVTALQQDPRLAGAVGACRDIDPAGALLGIPAQPLIHRDHYLALLKSCFILSGSSVVFTRSCLGAVAGFNESLRTGDDYDLYLRLARHYPLECHGRVVTEYRRHASSLTTDPAVTLAGELDALRAQRGVLRSRHERSALRSGRRRAKRVHGSALRRRLSEQVQRREWHAAMRSTRVLLRNHPRGLAQALRDLWLVPGFLGGAGPASLAIDHD